MNKFVFFFIALLFAGGIAVAQDAGMKGMMKGEQGQHGGMGMMNMMEQCNAMMKAKSASQETVLDILKKRYARGEINRQEFEAMKKDVQ